MLKETLIQIYSNDLQKVIKRSNSIKRKKIHGNLMKELPIQAEI